MNARLFRTLIALCGIIGGVVLGASFAINPGPPAGSTLPQVVDFVNQNRTIILIGGWTQGMGSLIIVLFAIGIVHLAGATNRFAGWATLLAGATILMVSLVEISFYLLGVQAAASRDTSVGVVSLALIKAVQHIFLVAPALLLPLSAVLLGSRLLPRVFGYLGLAIGLTLQLLGLAGLFDALQPVIDVLLMVQNVWILAVAIMLVVRPRVEAKMVAAA